MGMKHHISLAELPTPGYYTEVLQPDYFREYDGFVVFCRRDQNNETREHPLRS